MDDIYNSTLGSPPKTYLKLPELNTDSIRKSRQVIKQFRSSCSGINTSMPICCGEQMHYEGDKVKCKKCGFVGEIEGVEFIDG